MKIYNDVTELIGNTPRKLWVKVEPTVNDLAKNEEESNA